MASVLRRRKGRRLSRERPATFPTRDDCGTVAVEMGPMMSTFLRLTMIATTMTSLVACASAPEMPLGPVSLVANAGLPVPPQGRLVADCVAASLAARTYDRDSDVDTELLRFTCSGAVAQALYDDLAVWSMQRDSQIVADGRTWRFTSKLNRDVFGADGCSSDGVSDYRCTINLNVGGYLAAP